MLLAVSSIKKDFGPDEVLTNVSFRIDRREKVALVGRNGTGKTTLLKIITGQLEADEGNVQLARGAKIGYLRQESPVDLSNTVLQEAEAAKQQALDIQQRMHALEKRLESDPSQQELEEYATLHEHYMEIEGYVAERDMRTVLARMGFSEQELTKPTRALSGGEKTRLALARLLLEQPDLLLLDEPTNHLDLQATEWLEGWLRSYPGAVLLVSHDRAFLGNVAQRVLDLRDGQVESYPGPFEKFLKLRAEAEIRQAEIAKKQQAEIEKLDEYVRRFINSQRTAQARGRKKQMEKLIASSVQAPKKQKNMKAAFASAPRSGDLAVQIEGVTKSFGEQQLFKDVDWTVRYGERWGVIGENGAGKSTLIKIALGLLEPDSGRARLGSRVVAGYFAQDTVTLDPDQSPLDYLVWEFDLLPPDARNLLGRFLITGDDVYRPIRTLSGGEKNKLALASLTTLNPNLLVLDEPTNHLDMDSREALANVLSEFNGTLILVSHDRWLLQRVTDHTLDLRRSGVVLYNGSYGEYRQGGSGERRPLDGAQGRKERGEWAMAPREKVKSSQSETLSPRELSKEITRREKLVMDIEHDIHEREAQLQELENTLANVPRDADVLQLTKLYAHLHEQIAGKMAVWEEQISRLEELRQRQISHQ